MVASNPRSGRDCRSAVVSDHDQIRERYPRLADVIGETRINVDGPSGRITLHVGG